MVVLFLDFDGVLRNVATRFRSMDPACVARLDALCRETGAGVVVTSTWRHSGLGRCRAMLREAGFRQRVLGATPVLRGQPRGAEIAAWLARHPACASFAILDDDAAMGEYLPRLVRTAPQVGLTEADAARVVALLGDDDCGRTPMALTLATPARGQGAEATRPGETTSA